MPENHPPLWGRRVRLVPAPPPVRDLPLPTGVHDPVAQRTPAVQRAHLRGGPQRDRGPGLLLAGAAGGEAAAAGGLWVGDDRDCRQCAVEPERWRVASAGCVLG